MTGPTTRWKDSDTVERLPGRLHPQAPFPNSRLRGRVPGALPPCSAARSMAPAHRTGLPDLGARLGMPAALPWRRGPAAQWRRLGLGCPAHHQDPPTRVTGAWAGDWGRVPRTLGRRGGRAMGNPGRGSSEGVTQGAAKVMGTRHGAIRGAGRRWLSLRQRQPAVRERLGDGGTGHTDGNMNLHGWGSMQVDAPRFSFT